MSCTSCKNPETDTLLQYQPSYATARAKNIGTALQVIGGLTFASGIGVFLYAPEPFRTPISSTLAGFGFLSVLIGTFIKCRC